MSLCGGPPAPDPGIAEAARANAQLAREALQWYQGIYATDIKPAQDEDRAMRQQLIQQFLGDSAFQREFAREQQDYYRQTFRPVEEQVARDAMNYDSDENIARRQGIAGAAVTQAFSSAREQAARDLQRRGLNPNSGSFAAMNSRLANAEALGVAGARTGAAFDTIDRGIALRAGAANFGRNMPNTAAGYFGLANQTSGMAGAQSLAGLESMRGGAQFAGQGFGVAGQLNSSAGNLYGQDFQGRMAGYDSQMRLIGGLVGAGATIATGFAPSSKDYKENKSKVRDGDALGGIKRLDIDSWNYKGERDPHVGPYAEDFQREFGLGNGKEIALQDAIGVTMKAVQDLSDEVDSLKGKKRGLRRANGGKVHKGKGTVKGPGGPVDDKIPAMLSNGEYVLPADTVKKIGVQNLDAIVKKTHTPAAEQRRGLRRK